ncbi:ABC transporter substrate-binding protein [Mumia sp. DW29H23]|uniref:ABC transporter substrate-binding protein n=1 Tax=Mumia sp. DW29H23 TaxID=3421241 RepID=UPI003D686D70
MNKIGVTAAVCLALALTGCGGDGGDGDDGDGPRQVTVGMLPIVPTAALYAGIDQGFFADHDIELEIETGQGGAALLPAVMSQEIDFATSNPVSLLTARDKGLDVEAVSHWTSEHEDAADSINAVIAAKDSGITSAKDLEGKTVAINTVQSMGDLTIREAVRKDGGDPDTVEFIELGFPDMPAALAKGNADAVWVPEPFMSGLLAEGNQLVTNPCLVAAPGMPTQLMFTSATLAEKDPDLVEDMTAALEETLQYAEDNPDAVREKIPEVNPNIKADTAAKIKLEAFGTDMREAQLEQIGALMEDEGWIENEPDVSGLLGSGE